jgi:hypothetical protein
MFTGVYRLEPAQMLSAWEPRTQRLRLPGPIARRPGTRAELRIEIAGIQVLASVAGTVTAVHHGEDEDDGFELAPDAESLRAVGMLVAAAKGEPVKFARRPPRYVVRLPATVSFPDSRRVLATTESVSEGGCGLAWSGRPPEVGQALRVRLEGGPRPAENLGTVCWSSVAPHATLTGVQFVGAHAPQAWLALVATLARGGAPRA